MEQFEYHEKREEVKERSVEKRPAKSISKRETRFEGVPEKPGITRKLLFYKPFKIYEDTIDLASQNFKSVIDKVPSVFTIIDSDEKHFVIGDERGKHIGLVSKNVLKYEAMEWDTFEVRIFPKNTEIELSDDAQGTSIKRTKLSDETIVAMTSEGEEEWKRCGPVLKGNRLSEENRPIWIRIQTHGIENGRQAVVASEIDAKRWLSRMKGFIEGLHRASREELRDTKSALDAIQKTTIALLNGYTGSLPASIDGKKRDASVMADILNITASDMGRMDDEQFQTWIDSLEQLVDHQVRSLNEWEQKGKTSGIPLFRNNGSNPENLFLIR